MLKTGRKIVRQRANRIFVPAFGKRMPLRGTNHFRKKGQELLSRTQVSDQTCRRRHPCSGRRLRIKFEKEMKRFLFLPLLSLLLASCGLVRITGVHSDYSRLTEAQRAKVRPWEGSIDSLTYDEDVHVVGMPQIKAFLAAHDSVMVYFWHPYCTSDVYLSPKRFEEYCHERNWVPCILLRFFYWRSMPAAGEIRCPLLFIDPRPYGTDEVRKYMEEIENELVDGKNSEEEDSNFYFLFESGKFVKAFNRLP